jgi:hypothetical protein
MLEADALWQHRMAGSLPILFVVRRFPILDERPSRKFFGPCAYACFVATTPVFV